LSPAKVEVHELMAWGLDEYSFRSCAINLGAEEIARQVDQAERRLARRKCYASSRALLLEETESIGHLLAATAQRIDLQEEYEGLDWTLGVVDVRGLLAFQRRLVFEPTQDSSPIPRQDDWPGLVSFAMGSRRDTEYDFVSNQHATAGLDITLHSTNPDLQLQVSRQNGHDDCLPLVLYGGSPFFEVGELRGRWFLRDGYHRAYRLLQAGVHRIPAAVIHARTIEELGATKPWFFGETQLFSERPPQVTDFLDGGLVLRYERVALRKFIRIRIEESLQPFDGIDEIQGGKV
jgi:hypothetical protein